MNRWLKGTIARGLNFTAFWRRSFVVLTYHGIYSNKNEEPSDIWGLHVPLEDIVRQLETFSLFFKFVTIDEVIEHYTDHKPLPKFAALLTFDDGYKNILHPVLRFQRSGFPVTVFLVTNKTGQKIPYWWDRLEAIVMSTMRGELRLTIEGVKDVFSCSTQTRKDKIRTAYFLRQILYQAPKSAKGQILGQVADKLECDLESAAKIYRSRATLNWDEIKALHGKGVKFASHTSEHEVMKLLTESELESDLLLSRRVLLEELGECPDCLCYPFGQSDLFDEKSLRCVERAGFKVGFTNYAAKNGRDSNPFLLGRVNMNNYCPKRFAYLRYALYCFRQSLAFRTA